MALMAIISLFLSIVAILIAGWALLYTKRQADYAKRQTNLMEEQDARKKREDATTGEWARKFDDAVGQVIKIAPKNFPSSLGRVYDYIFSDIDRQRIEKYLINADLGRNYYTARQTTGEQLRMPIVQQTIQIVLDKIETFKKTDNNAKGLSL
jgi:hypothetical protein